MAPRNNVEDNSRGIHALAATSQRPGHRIREIRQDLHERHRPARYRVTRSAEVPPKGRPRVLSVASDEYQTRLYRISRRTDPRESIAAVREAMATSPHTWEDFTVDGAREWVEESIDDDELLAAAVDSLGTLETEERPYLGKFIAELLYEMLTDAEADFWYRFWRRAGTYPT